MSTAYRALGDYHPDGREIANVYQLRLLWALVTVADASLPGGPGLITACTPGTVTVTDQSQVVLVPNPARLSAVFVDVDANNSVFLARGTSATANRGIALMSGGGTYEIDARNLYRGPVSAVCAAGQTAILTFEEGQ